MKSGRQRREIGWRAVDLVEDILSTVYKIVEMIPVHERERRLPSSTRPPCGHDEGPSDPRGKCGSVIVRDEM